jgi:hypothetical protein
MNLATAQSLDQHENSFEGFKKTAKEAISSFATDNSFILKLENKSLKISDYHSLLLAIFHQVFNSSNSFALAGSMCTVEQVKIREYLFHHSEEEMTHWQWIIEDLKATAYSGKDPRELNASVSATAYLSYGYYLALKFPVGRLGMALVLEGISSSFGLKYGREALKVLNLNPSQARFFLSHGELDQDHEKDILSLIAESNLSSDEYKKLTYVAKTTANLYKKIYNDL